MKQSVLKISCLFGAALMLFFSAAPSCSASPVSAETSSVPQARSSLIDTYWFENVYVEIEVRKDKTAFVKEAHTVGFLYDNENTGFIRDIQRISRTTRIIDGRSEQGAQYIANISGVDVTIDGGEAKVTQGLYSEGEFYSVKMQLPDESYFPATDQTTGEGYHVFELFYVLDLSDDKADGYDDFTFDVLGYAMAYTETFSAKITFPSELSLSDVSMRTNKTAGWSPDAGRGESFLVSGNTVTIAARPHSPNKGYTLQVLFPDGYFERDGITFFWYYALFAAAAAAGIAASFVIFLIYRPRKPVEQIEFYPPEGMRPMRFSAVWNGGARLKDVSAIIMQWADDGYVKLTKDGENDLTVTKLTDLSEECSAEERDYFNAMFPTEVFMGSDEFSTKRMKRGEYPERARKLSLAAGRLKESADKPDPLFRGSLRAHILFTLCSLVPFLAFFIYLCILIASPLPFFLFIFVAAGTFVGSMQARQRLIWLMYLFPVTFTAMPVAVTVTALYIPLYDYAGLLWIALAWWAVSLVLAHFLKRRSPEAQKELGKLCGFRRFLLTAELSRIEMLFDENPNYYSNIIPYCLVMGISGKVAKRFEALNVAAPVWAEGIPASSFSSFGRALSSSSGGGHSGGGGRGGSSGGGGGGGGSRGC